MRHIIHDWPDAESLEILKHIRSAASPSSKLILFDFCIQHACPDTEHSSYGGDVKSPPYPLLANYGAGGGTLLTHADMQARISRFYITDWGFTEHSQMLTFFNAQERAVRQFAALGNASGWRLESVKLTQPATFVFVPV